MKTIRDYMSPLSWLCCILACWAPLLVILRPTLLEGISVLVPDLLMSAVFCRFDGWMFLKLYPDARSYFWGIDEKHVRGLPDRERARMVESLMGFPWRRALFGYFFSWPKGIPAFLIVTFYWHHPRSDLAQLAVMMSITLLTFTYFFGAIFIENHDFASRLIADLDRRFDFSEAFRQVKPPYSPRQFEFQEFITFFFIVIFTLGLQLVVITQSPGGPRGVSLELSVIGVLGLGLLARVWVLGRRYFAGGLERVSRAISEIDLKGPGRALPLHTSPILARFEQAFNDLSERLRDSERELSHLVLSEAEKSRYRLLGEMSALIAHDLSKPLHVAKYCADQLLELRPPMPEVALPFLTRLGSNIDRTVELTQSLRARLKNPTHAPDRVSFLEAHRHVLLLLETQFGTRGFSKVVFELDPALEGLALKLQRIDLIHVLDNLYRNSVENLLDHSVEAPRVSISLDVLSENRARIRIDDNGSGLSSERFASLTEVPGEADGRGVALGLRLTRRLLEMHGGKLAVVDRENRTGTSFCLEASAAQASSEGAQA